MKAVPDIQLFKDDKLQNGNTHEIECSLDNLLNYMFSNLTEALNQTKSSSISHLDYFNFIPEIDFKEIEVLKDLFEITEEPLLNYEIDIKIRNKKLLLVDQRTIN